MKLVPLLLPLIHSLPSTNHTYMRFTDLVQIVDEELTIKNPILRKNFGSEIRLEILSNYGCWCHRGRNFGSGAGRPRDKFDKMCQAHHQAYECIKIDAELNGEPECDPQNETQEGYFIDVRVDLSNPHSQAPEYVLECASPEQQSWCKAKTCEVDIQYIKDFWDLTTKQSLLPDFSLFHRDSEYQPGPFDPSECPIGGKEWHPYKKCCGKYPNRKIYRSSSPDADTGSNQCCVSRYGQNDGWTTGKIFKPATHTCCANIGVIPGKDQLC